MTTTARVATLLLSETTSALIFSTDTFTASPMIVFWKLLLPKSTLPPPKPPQPPPPPVSDVLVRFDSPMPSATARISPVSTLIRRAVRPTMALLSLLAEAAEPIRPSPPPTPPMPVFLVSLPNCVMLPTMIASTPSSLPIFGGRGRVGAVAVREVLLRQNLVERACAR